MTRPRLFEKDLPHDPKKPIRHPYDAKPYVPPDRILDEYHLLREVWTSPGRCCRWYANTPNQRLALHMTDHGWLEMDENGMFELTDDGYDAMDSIDRGHEPPDWERPAGALF